MNTTKKLWTCFVLLLVAEFTRAIGTNVNDDDPNKIEALDYEYFKAKKSEEIARQCNTAVMNAYGLGADAATLSEPNSVCPSIQGNCCGPRDQKNIYELWKRYTKKMSVHYMTVLLIYKYILGYGKKYYDIAAKVASSYENAKELGTAGKPQTGGEAKPVPGNGELVIRADKDCNNAAEYVLGQGYYERPLAEGYYRELSERVQFLHNTRRGFYCMLCSIEGQKAIHNTPWLFQWIYSDRIYYNREFCKMLVDFSFRITYDLAKNFNKYLKSVIKITTCVDIPKAGSSTTTTPSKPNEAPVQPSGNNAAGAVTPALKALLKNPLDLGDSIKLEMCDLATGSNFMVFEKCEYWCQRWSIAKPRSLFDGSTKALKRIYNHLIAYEPILKAPEANLFKDDMTKMRRDIAALIDKRAPDKFLAPISSYLDLSEFKSDFVYSSKGINPMELAKGSPLPFSYTSVRILSTIFAFIALFLF